MRSPAAVGRPPVVAGAKPPSTQVIPITAATAPASTARASGVDQRPPVLRAGGGQKACPMRTPREAVPGPFSVNSRLAHRSPPQDRFAR